MAASRLLALLLLLTAHVPGARLQSAPTYDAYPPRSLEPRTDPRKWTIYEVADWVESAGFFEYREAFLEAAVNGEALLRMDESSLGKLLMLSSADHVNVLDMEITELRARRGLLSGAELNAYRQAHPHVSSLDVGGVGQLLQEAGFSRHVSAFAGARINGRTLLQLTDEQITTLAMGAQPNQHELNEAEAEQLVAMVEHLRSQAMVGGGGGRAGNRDEL